MCTPGHSHLVLVGIGTGVLIPPPSQSSEIPRGSAPGVLGWEVLPGRAPGALAEHGFAVVFPGCSGALLRAHPSAGAKQEQHHLLQLYFNFPGLK